MAACSHGRPRPSTTRFADSTLPQPARTFSRPFPHEYLNDLNTEGRAKGYLNAGLELNIDPGSIALAYHFKF